MTEVATTSPGGAVVDDLDAAYAEIRKDPYVFSFAGREWLLPHFSDLDYRTMMRIESYQQLGAEDLTTLFGDLFTPEQRAAWAEVHVPLPVLFMLFDRWTKHSGGQLGEDEASSDSSENTGQRSRRTSGGGTGSASPKRSTAKTARAKAGSQPGNSST